MARIGFIGLGNMGAPMALNLKKGGHDVIGFDLAEPIRAAAEKAGLSVASSCRAVVHQSDVVITMLPAGAHVLSVWAEALGHAGPNSLFIDCSTIDVASAQRAHALAEERGISALDAPVSGGVGGAKDGKLTFMVGGQAPALERGRPFLELMGARIVHCGEAGAGQSAKICNNMIAGISMIAVAEAFNLGRKLGLSAQALFEVASTSSGQCWALTTYCPVPGPVPASPANNEYRPGFATKLMLKDLRLAQQAAAALGANTPLGAEAAQLYSLFASSGNEDVDFSGIIKFLWGTGPASDI